WWGLNDDIRALTDRFAAAGFVALAIDYYDGAVTADAGEAMKLVEAMKTPDAVDIARGAARLLATHPRSNGKVGVTGFCMGGAVTLAASCHAPEIGAFVPFYGLPLPKYVDWTETLGPIQGHFGAKDRLIDVKRAEAVRDAVLAAGGSFELCIYDAG